MTFVGACLLLALVPVAACTGPGSATAAAAPAGDPAGELLARRGDFERRVLLTGSLQAARAVTLTVPRNPSWQVELRWIAEDGKAVRADEPVIELDDSSFATELENQESTLADRTAELARREIEILVQTRDKEIEVLRRRADLEKAALEADVPDGILPRQDLEERRLAQVRTKLALAKAEADLAAHRAASAADLEILRIEIRKLRREIDASRGAIRELQIRAPVDGIFLVGDHPWHDRKLQVGDTAWVGMAAATIPDLSSVVVEARLPDVDDGSVAPGMPSVTTLDAFPGTTFQGRVREVAPVAQDEGTQSLRRFFHTVVELEEIDSGRMIPGMSARVEVVADRREDAVLAPRRALSIARAGEALLHLAGGGIATVELGPCNDFECVVEAGVEPGTALAEARAPRVAPASAGERER